MNWLADAGELGRMVRDADWSTTELGAMDTWSPSCQTAIGICLRSPVPAAVFLGRAERLIYNDRFIPFLPAGSHPTALGQPGFTVAEMVVRGTFATSPIIGPDGVAEEGKLCTYAGTPRASTMDDIHELRAAVDLVGLGRYRSDPLTQEIEWDAHLKAMWDLPTESPVDLAVFLRGIHPDDRDRVAAALGQSVDPAGDGVCDIEYRVVGVNGGFERWVATRGKTVFEQDRVVSFHGVVLDISERKRAEQTNVMLIAELQHRTRNLLAVVDGLAEQTLASCKTLADFAVPFRQQLATLSRVQGLLSRGEASPATISELVELELSALGAKPDGVRVIIRGPDVALPSRSVQILALGLHELATNARKHGALASRDGQLSVTWTVEENGGARRLILKWEETGIVARGASDAERVGLGRTLIEESLPFQLDAETQLVIGSDTVRCSVALALE
jgi:two-component sensor histidine kinase/PAS domain-containing protein